MKIFWGILLGVSLFLQLCLASTSQDELWSVVLKGVGLEDKHEVSKEIVTDFLSFQRNFFAEQGKLVVESLNEDRERELEKLTGIYQDWESIRAFKDATKDQYAKLKKTVNTNINLSVSSLGTAATQTSFGQAMIQVLEDQRASQMRLLRRVKVNRMNFSKKSSIGLQGRIKAVEKRVKSIDASVKATKEVFQVLDEEFNLAIDIFLRDEVPIEEFASRLRTRLASIEGVELAKLTFCMAKGVKAAKKEIQQQLDEAKNLDDEAFSSTLALLKKMDTTFALVANRLSLQIKKIITEVLSARLQSLKEQKETKAFN